MPDNPHPHPPEFTASRQQALLRVLSLVLRRMTNMSYQKTVAGNGKVTAFNYIIKPEV